MKNVGSRSLDLRTSGLMPGLALWLVLIVSYCAYFPGLSGTFVLDDASVLHNLVIIESADDFDEILNYVLSGGTGPTSRPVSTLSYALQFHAWPTSVETFRHFDVLLHLLTGVIVFLLARRLSVTANVVQGARLWVALLAAGIWLLHPLQITTVLYTAQRMTQLASLFSLLAVLSWIGGRTLLLERAKASPAALVLLVAWPAALLLGVLSKESAFNALLYIVVLEATLLAPPNDSRWRWWRHVALTFPVLVVVGYFILRWPTFMETYSFRDFTLAERLLTQPRVLLDYLRQLLLPFTSTPSLFHDDFTISRHLFSPWTTLPALLTVIAASGVALKWRRRYPLMAFAVLWFLAGHALEGTFLPLEMYFEHRNYLPVLGPVLATVIALARHFPCWTLRRRRAAVAGAVLVTVALGVSLHGHARTWSNPTELTERWHQEHPESLRANTARTIALASQRQYADLRGQLGYMLQRFPEDPSILSLWLLLSCSDSMIPFPDLAKVVEQASTARYVHSVRSMIDRILAMKERDNRACPQLDAAFLVNYTRAFVDNPAHRRHTGGLGRVNLARALRLDGRIDSALAELELASKQRDGSVDIYGMAAIWSAEYCRFSESRRYLEQARSIAARSIVQSTAYGERLDWAETKIEHLKRDCAQRQGSEPLN